MWCNLVPPAWFSSPRCATQQPQEMGAQPALLPAIPLRPQRWPPCSSKENQALLRLHQILCLCVLQLGQNSPDWPVTGSRWRLLAVKSHLQLIKMLHISLITVEYSRFNRTLATADAVLWERRRRRLLLGDTGAGGGVSCIEALLSCEDANAKLPPPPPSLVASSPPPTAVVPLGLGPKWWGVVGSASPCP